MKHNSKVHLNVYTIYIMGTCEDAFVHERTNQIHQHAAHFYHAQHVDENVQHWCAHVTMPTMMITNLQRFELQLSLHGTVA